jgi:hypothetical protein
MSDKIEQEYLHWLNQHAFDYMEEKDTLEIRIPETKKNAVVIWYNPLTWF